MVFGAVVDIVATNILVGLLALYTALTHHISGDAGALLEYMRTDAVLSVALIILGGAASILGGYVAARIAKRDVLLNAGLASFLCVASAVVALFAENTSLVIVLIDIFASPLLSLMGGYIHLRQISLKTSEPKD